MPYDEPYSPLDGLGAITTEKDLLRFYTGVKRKNRLKWLEKRLTEFQKRLDTATQRAAAAKKTKAKKFWAREIKIINNLIAQANKLKRREEARRGLAPPPLTHMQIDQAVEAGQAETKLEEIADIKEETPELLVSERKEKVSFSRIPTVLTEIMSDIEATENFPFRMYFMPVVREGVKHTDVRIEPIKGLSPEAVKGYTLRQRNGELIIEPIAETLAPAGLGVLPVAAAAVVAQEIPGIVQSVTQVGMGEISKILSQGGVEFNLQDFIKNNITDIKTELSDKVHDLTGGAFGKKKKKTKWYQKHGWKNKPPKDCPKYKDKTGGKHCMFRAAYRLWAKLGKPPLAYGKYKLAGMRALEVLVKARKKKSWLVKVGAKGRKLGATPYDVVNWAVQNVPGFDPREAGVPTELVTAREIEMANQAAGEDPVVRPDVPLLETTGGKIAVGGGALLAARALGLF